MMSLYKPLLNFIFHCWSIYKPIWLFTARFWLKVDILIVYFFAHNSFGYFLYVFLLYSGFVFGPKVCMYYAYPFYAKVMCGFVAGITVQTYLLLKVKPMRQFVEYVVGKPYLVAYLGQYTGSAATWNIAKIVGPVVGVFSVMAADAAITEVRANRQIEGLDQKFEKLFPKPTEDQKLQHYQNIANIRREAVAPKSFASGPVENMYTDKGK